MEMAVPPIIVYWEIISLFKRTSFLGGFLMPSENIDFHFNDFHTISNSKVNVSSSLLRM